MSCPGCRLPLQDPVEVRLGCCRRCIGMTDAEFEIIDADDGEPMIRYTPPWSGDDPALRLMLAAAIERAIPLNVVCWPANYDRRYGELDQHQRQEIVTNAVDGVLAVAVDLGMVAPPQPGANGRLTDA